MMTKVTTPPCMMCGKDSTLEVDVVNLRLWQSGVPIQDAFPEKTDDERELLKTGTHPFCWEQMFGGVE